MQFLVFAPYFFVLFFPYCCTLLIFDHSETYPYILDLFQLRIIHGLGKSGPKIDPTGSVSGSIDVSVLNVILRL